MLAQIDPTQRRTLQLKQTSKILFTFIKLSSDLFSHVLQYESRKVFIFESEVAVITQLNKDTIRKHKTIFKLFKSILSFFLNQTRFLDLMLKQRTEANNEFENRTNKSLWRRNSIIFRVWFVSTFFPIPKKWLLGDSLSLTLQMLTRIVVQGIQSYQIGLMHRPPNENAGKPETIFLQNL